MKILFQIIIAIGLCVAPYILFAQYKDTTVAFTVDGNCEQCKQRIEKAAKAKGVSQAVWDVDTKVLRLAFNPHKTNIATITQRIVAAGHDIGALKATENVYDKLPACCKYRPNEKVIVDSIINQAKDSIAKKAGTSIDKVIKEDKPLMNVTVTTRQRATFTAALSSTPTQMIGSRELLKAACCNLSESFETNPSVDVSYNDAVTGSKQIQLLGLSGIYTQLTVENLPGPRGLGTPLGLNSIAGPWIEGIQLTKGVGSVANGYESIAGQINVELKKPDTKELMYANAYINESGKTDLNLNLSQKLGKKWGSMLLLHDDFLYNKTVDFNKDGFRDLPTGNLFSGISRWQYNNGKGFGSQFGVKVLKDDKVGGQVNFNPSIDKFGSKYYGLGIHTERYEAFGKTGYIFPQKKYQSIGLQLSAIHHEQTAYFGNTMYDGKQQSFYSNLIFQSIIGSTNHQYRAGLSFVYDGYEEHFQQTPYNRNEIVPGAFAEYTYNYLTQLTLVAGLRTDYNNLFGWFATPRLHVKYAPFKGNTIRLSIGRGQRTANIFAENNSIFASARQVQILSASNDNAYGLQPEIAWNKGISINQTYRLFHNGASTSIDFFRNDFQNQVIVDVEDARTVKIYNLNGKSFSNSFQIETALEPVKRLEVKLAYRYFDVRQTIGGALLQKALTATNRAFLNVGYELKGWKLDYTISYTGKKRIPSTAINPKSYQLEGFSPSYVTMNAQVSTQIGKHRPLEWYVGGENLSNYFQKGAIIASDAPFSQYFDASLVWGPLTGRMFYTGLRWKLGKVS